jgi:hypothetical protein
MAITQTGSTLSFNTATNTNTGTASTTITVPGDAEFAVAAVSCAASAALGYFSSGSVTLTKGGVDTAMTVASTAGDNTNAGFWAAAMWYMALPDTGSNKSLKWDWLGAAGSDRVIHMSLTFWTGADTSSPVRSTSGAQPTGLPFTTGTLTAESGDLIIAFAAAFNGGADSTAGAWSGGLATLSDLALVDNGDSAWATASPSGNTTVGLSTATGWEDGAIVAIVVKPAGGGGGGLLIPVARNYYRMMQKR